MKVLLGLRSWQYRNGAIRSPVLKATWPNGELRAAYWSVNKALRGESGIHANNLPDGDWRTAELPSEWKDWRWDCFGTVQALGKVVKGTIGWRAEKARIVELVANKSVVKEIEDKFPHIIVHVMTDGMLPKRYRIVFRPGGKRGTTIKAFTTMEEARKFADARIKSSAVGDVLVIYVDCPSMPLDARYYVKDVDGKTYQSRARTYNKKKTDLPFFQYSDKWMKVVSVMKRTKEISR